MKRRWIEEGGSGAKARKTNQYIHTFLPNNQRHPFVFLPTFRMFDLSYVFLPNPSPKPPVKKKRLEDKRLSHRADILMRERDPQRVRQLVVVEIDQCSDSLIHTVHSNVSHTSVGLEKLKRWGSRGRRLISSK